MKKFLGLLAALGLTATASSAAVSCGTSMTTNAYPQQLNRQYLGTKDNNKNSENNLDFTGLSQEENNGAILLTISFSKDLAGYYIPEVPLVDQDDANAKPFILSVDENTEFTRDDNDEAGVAGNLLIFNISDDGIHNVDKNGTKLIEGHNYRVDTKSMDATKKSQLQLNGKDSEFEYDHISH